MRVGRRRVFRPPALATPASNTRPVPESRLPHVDRADPARDSLCAEMPPQIQRHVELRTAAAGAYPKGHGFPPGYGAPCLFKLRYGGPGRTRINDLRSTARRTAARDATRCRRTSTNARTTARSNDSRLQPPSFPRHLLRVSLEPDPGRRDLPDVRDAERTCDHKKGLRPDETCGVRLVEGDFPCFRAASRARPSAASSCGKRAQEASSGCATVQRNQSSVQDEERWPELTCACRAAG